MNNLVSKTCNITTINSLLANKIKHNILFTSLFLASMGNILRGNPRQSFEKQSDVSLNLAKHLMLNYAKDSNFVFSPVSIQLILGLIAAGSGAQTLKQLLSFLQAKTIDDLNTIYSHLVALVLAKSSNNLCLSFANGVWADESVCLKPLFKHVVHSLYKATSYQVDFQNKVRVLFNILLIHSPL